MKSSIKLEDLLNQKIKFCEEDLHNCNDKNAKDYLVGMIDAYQDCLNLISKGDKDND